MRGQPFPIYMALRGLKLDCCMHFMASEFLKSIEKWKGA